VTGIGVGNLTLSSDRKFRPRNLTLTSPSRFNTAASRIIFSFAGPSCSPQPLSIPTRRRPKPRLWADCVGLLRLTYAWAHAPNKGFAISRICQNSARRLSGDLITARQVLDQNPNRAPSGKRHAGFFIALFAYQQTGGYHDTQRDRILDRNYGQAPAWILTRRPPSSVACGWCMGIRNWSKNSAGRTRARAALAGGSKPAA